MKYTRMLCWVRPHEKKELNKAINKKFPLVFAKNYDDFCQKISDGDYLIISLAKARCGKKIFDLVRLHRDKQFFLYEIKDNELNTNSGFLLMSEPNVTDGQYNAEELKDNYLGIIPDLWKYRKKDSIVCVSNDE